jgi:ribosomal protein L16 Arg81 hydroxylase
MEAYLDGNENSEITETEWTADSTCLTPEWLLWMAESRLHGSSDEQIQATLAEAGYNHAVVAATLDTLQNDPYYLVAQRTVQRWKKLKSILDIRRSLANLSYGSDDIERRGSVSQSEFLERYYAANRPVILTGLLNDSRAFMHWTPDHFAQTCGDAMVQVMFGRQDDPSYEINSESHKIELRMSEYVNMVVYGGTTNDYYLVANNGFFERPETQALFDEIPQLPEYLNHSNSQRKVFLWFGPGGTVTPLHHDVMNIMVAQIIGRKRFTLIPPEQTPYLYNELSVYSQVDCRNPDYSRHPLYRQVTSVDIVLEPGELLFIPVGWWHSVESLETSIMLSYINFKFPNEYEWSNPDIR